MKRNLIYLVVAACALLAVSCNRKVDFEYVKYATLCTTSYNVAEDAGEFTIPVVLMNGAGGEAQISVSLEALTAEEGADYELVTPVNGILNFTGDADTLNVVVAVTSHVGVNTGNKAFNVKLSSLTDGVQCGNINTARVTIADLDHPLAGFVGDWDGAPVFASDPPEAIPTTLSISIDDEDETNTRMYIIGLEAAYAQYAVPVVGVYDADRAIVTVQAGQQAMYVSSAYNFIFIGLDESWANIINLEMKYDAAAGTLTTLNTYGVVDNNTGDLYTAYEPGAVFTKK